MASPTDSAASPARGARICHKCVHYFITHNVSFPYGCRALDFKSRQLPCLEVLAASGQTCQLFQPKASPAGKGPQRSWRA